MHRKVILFPTYEQALSFRKCQALAQNNGFFGIDVETPFTWLSTAWERFGDGSKIVTATDRAFAVRVLLESNPFNPAEYSDDTNLLFPISTGTISLVSRFLSNSVGLITHSELEENGRSGFSPLETYLVNLIDLYRNLLSKNGLIEQGDALSVLGKKDLPFEFEFGCQFSISPVFERFFASKGVIKPLEAVQISRLDNSVTPYFLLSTGPSAQNSLIYKWLQSSFISCKDTLANKKILIISSNPCSIFNFLSNSLRNDSIACSLYEKKRFDETEFGRAFIALKTFLLDGNHDLKALLDFVQSPFSGIDSVQASQITSAIHGDRLLSYDEIHAMIHLMSPYFDAFEEIILDSDASLLLDYIADIASSLQGKDAAYRSEQSSVIGALRSVYECARRWNLTPSEIDFALEGISLNISTTTMLHDAEVIIASPNCSDGLLNESYSQVIICDLDSRYYSAGERHDSLVTLQNKLGIVSRDSLLNDQRLWFEQVKSCAQDYFVCERILDSGDSDDIYPSFLWEDFISCYLDAGEKLDSHGIPFALSKNVLIQGEEHYFENSDVLNSSLQPLDISISHIGNDLSKYINSLFLSRTKIGESEKLILSPSAIEAYINCPYLWFVSQRIRPNVPDEELGPLEQGTFVHGVFEEFYKQLPDLVGSCRVTSDNLKDATRLLGQVFDTKLSKQAELETVRYVPQSSVELAQAENLKQILIKNLSIQARMLSSFAPTYNELMIKPEDNCEYAGVIIRGRVDRIDCNPDLGQFVVLDYKGSVSGHSAGFDPDSLDDDRFKLPHKVQTLIYAQVLQKMLPERAVGALYFSYRAKESRGSFAGSYDDSQLNMKGYATSASAVMGNFSFYLNTVEKAIEGRLQYLKKGYVEPDPLCPDSCRYCPFTACSRRLS